jgi:hypothetical protein
VRTVLALVLVAGFVLSAISLGTAWWAYSASSGGAVYSLQFVPGSSYPVSCTGACGGYGSGSNTYADFGGSLASLYGSLESALVLAVVLAGITTLFGVLAVIGRGDRRFGVVAFLVGLLAGAVLLGLGFWVEAAQPGAFGAGVTFHGLPPGGPSPASSFWGSYDSGGSSASWGAGAGWYGAMIGGAFVLAAAISLLVLGWRSASRPAPREPRAFAPATVPYRESAGRPVYSPIVHAEPVVTPVAPPPWVETPVQATAKSPAPVLLKPSKGAEPTVECPACGYANSARARTCAYCQRAMKP